MKSRSYTREFLDQALFVGLMIALLWSPLPFGSVEAWSTALLELAAFALIAGWALLFIFDKQKPRLSPLFVLISLIIVEAVAQLWIQHKAAPLSFDPYNTRRAILIWTAMLVFFFLGMNLIRSKHRLYLFTSTLIIWGGMIASFSLIQYVFWNGHIYWLREIPPSNPFGPFVNRNHYAGFICMLVPLPLSLLTVAETPGKWLSFYLSITIIMSGSIIISGSRAGLLTLICEVLFLTLNMWEKIRIRFLFRSVIPLIVLLLIFTAKPVITRLNEPLSDSKRGMEVDRITIWKQSLQMLGDQPFIGVGLGAYATAYTQYDLSNGYIQVEQAHNDYLQLLAETGIVGGVIAVAFLFFLLRFSFLGLNRARNISLRLTACRLGALTGIIGLLIHSCFDFNLQIPSNALLFLLLCVCASNEVTSGV